MPPEKGYRGTVLFREMGNVELWDPLSGKIAEVPYRIEGNHTEVELDIPAGNSCFVVFSREGAGKAIQMGESLQAVDESKTGRPFMVCNQPESTGLLDLSEATWQLHFPGGWGVETSPLYTQQLTAWKDLPLSDEGKSFSGTATYETTFTLDRKSTSTAYRLDLGRVEVIAKVRVNGKEVGTCWTSPYVLDVTEYLQEGKNNLQVEVTSTWFNRLVYDAGLPEENRKTWTIAGPEANAPFKEYGLLGPVTIESVDY
jgi:hypothetical protein